jgi:hypothetical protein
MTDDSECNCSLKGEDRDSTCLARSPEMHHCTKPSGHDGPHSACSGTKHPFNVWLQDDTETTTDDTANATMASQSTTDDSNGMSICPHCETHIGYTKVPFECDECGEFVPELRI